MNAAVDELAAVAQSEKRRPYWRQCRPWFWTRALIARAMSEAERRASPLGKSWRGTRGFPGPGYARALAAAFDYRFVASDELARLEPDFSLLAPAEATRRHF